jgi:sugar-specific transcriptional regulator TrmB
MEKDFLSKLGLDSNETKIYLYLLKTGVQSVKQISEEIFINRTTVYRYLESLVKKGLAEWIISERGRKIQASPPENLSPLLYKKKSDIQELENNFPSFISNIKTLKPIQKLSTQVRYYTDEDGIEQIIWNTLSASKKTYSYAAFGRRNFINPAFEDKFEEEWARRGLKDIVITNQTHLDYVTKQLVFSYKKNLDIRIIPSSKFYISNDIIIYNNIIAIISLEKNNLVGVEIENTEIAKTQKSIFNIVWEVAKPLKTNV